MAESQALVQNFPQQQSAVTEQRFGDIVRHGGSTLERIGKVVRAFGNTVYVSGITASIGQRCVISTPGRPGSCFADVVGIADSQVILYLLGSVEGLSNLSSVQVLPYGRQVNFSPDLIGCILDGAGEVIQGPVDAVQYTEKLQLDRAAPNAMTRAPINQIFSTGVKSIDTMLTVGVGQRVGIFAAAGGGKSTLLSMLAKNSDAEVIVIGLIGERGREVKEFIDHNLGTEGMRKAVLVVSTSDRPAMERVCAAQTATAIAEGFRDEGKKVMLLLDSITRYARALREIGLAVGEPPVRRGFTPSVFSELPRLLERSGNNEVGSITAFYTVLIEDEDASDPVAEEVRSILDGHFVLTRELGESGFYPPIDVLASTSRLFDKIVNRMHWQRAMYVRELMSKYREIELLIQMGEYTEGSDPVADAAVQHKKEIEDLLRQHSDDRVGFDAAVVQLMAIG